MTKPRVSNQLSALLIALATVDVCVYAPGGLLWVLSISKYRLHSLATLSSFSLTGWLAHLIKLFRQPRGGWAGWTGFDMVLIAGPRKARLVGRR